MVECITNNCECVFPDNINQLSLMINPNFLLIEGYAVFGYVIYFLYCSTILQCLQTSFPIT